MYQKIAVPVDLAHKAHLEKAIKTAADLAKYYSADLTFIGVTASAPSEIAHNPSEYAEELDHFAAEKSSELGISIKSYVAVSHDPAIDLDQTLDEAIHQEKSDLVVMASHVPGLKDYVFSSNAGYLASHSDLSVMVIR